MQYPPTNGPLINTFNHGHENESCDATSIGLEWGLIWTINYITDSEETKFDCVQND